MSTPARETKTQELVNKRTYIEVAILVVGTISPSPAKLAGFSAGCFPSGLGLSRQPRGMYGLPALATTLLLIPGLSI